MNVPIQLANMTVKDVHPTEFQSEQVPDTEQSSIAKIVADYRKSKQVEDTPPPMREIMTDVRDVQPIPPGVPSIPTYVQEAQQLLLTYSHVASSAFPMLLSSAEAAVDQQLKSVFFMAQVNLFAPVFDLTKLPTDIRQRFQSSAAVGSQSAFYTVQKFAAKFSSKVFTELLLQQALQSKPTEAEEMRTYYLRTKDHLEGVRNQLWQQFFTSSNAAMQKFFKDLMQHYCALIGEFESVLQLVTEMSPLKKVESLRSLLETAFQDKTLDVESVSKIVRAPASQQRALVTMDGPSLICEYLKRKDLCDQISLPPETLSLAQPFFEQVSSLYSEFHTRLFQIGMRASMLFVKESNLISEQLQKSTRAIDDHQKKLTTALLQTNPTDSFAQYLMYVHSLFVSQTTQLVVEQHNKQVKAIQDMVDAAFTC